MKNVSPNNMTRAEAIRSLKDSVRAVDEIRPGFGFAVHRLLDATIAQTDGMQARHATNSNLPFESFGDFLVEVAKAADPASRPHARLVRAPSGANESDPTAGGFIVAPQWSDDLIYSVYAETVFAQLFDRRETSTQFASVKIPGIDETSRAEGSRSGGFIALWQGESVPSTPSTMRSKLVEFVGKKLSIFTRARIAQRCSDAPGLHSEGLRRRGQL